MFKRSNRKTQRFIYFDNNIYHKLKRDKEFYNNFNLYFKKHDLNLFKNTRPTFTYSQLLEDIGLGSKIMPEIQNDSSWKEVCKQWDNIKDIDSINKALEACFDAAYTIVKKRLELKDDHNEFNILKLINDKYEYIKKNLIKHQSILHQKSLDEYKKILEKNNNYIHEIAYELAWAFITSYDFIQSDKKREDRSKYFDALILYWYQEFSNGNQLCLYRLIDSVSEAFIEIKWIGKNPSYCIGKTSDLCDAEGINLIALGHYDSYSSKRLPVIFITTDNNDYIEQRISNFKGAFEKLKKENKFWSVFEIPGEAITIKLSPDKKDIISVNRIPYNTPFAQQPTNLEQPKDIAQ